MKADSYSLPVVTFLFVLIVVNLRVYFVVYCV